MCTSPAYRLDAKVAKFGFETAVNCGTDYNFFDCYIMLNRNKSNNNKKRQLLNEMIFRSALEKVGRDVWSVISVQQKKQISTFERNGRIFFA